MKFIWAAIQDWHARRYIGRTFKMGEHDTHTKENYRRTSDLYYGKWNTAQGEIHALKQRLAELEAKPWPCDHVWHAAEEIPGAGAMVAECIKCGAAPARTVTAPAPSPVAPDVSKLVDRFLGWPLPNDFQPDGGIVFARHYGTMVDGKFVELEREFGGAWWPSGTNLFDADQARAMFEYVLAAPAVADSDLSGADGLNALLTRGQSDLSGGE